MRGFDPASGPDPNDPEQVEQADAYAEVEHNEPPSSVHVWDGEAWVLPAEHELVMMEDLDVSADELSDAQQRVEDQSAMAAEESA